MQPEKLKEMGIENGFTNPREYMELFAGKLYFKAMYKTMASILKDQEMEEGELTQMVSDEMEFLFPGIEISWKEQFGQTLATAYMAEMIDVYHEDFDKPNKERFGCYTTVKLRQFK